MIIIIKALFGLTRKIPQGVKLLLTLLFAIPTLIMAFFVSHQNKERSFVQQYAWVWFVALTCWICLTVYCYKIDYDVLYALKYSSSQDATASWQEAAFSAAVIQFLLLFCGGSFFKNLIFVDFIKSIKVPPKTKEKPHPFPTIDFSPAHALQLLVLGALFAYGFNWTLTLSQKTGALARVEAQDNVDKTAKAYKERSSTLESNYADKVATYRADAQKQTAMIGSSYQDQIESLNNKYGAIIAGYEARHAQGSITKTYLQKRVNRYRAVKEKAIAPLLKERADKMEAIQAHLTGQLKNANGLHRDNKRAIDHQNSSDRAAISQQIQETAKTTQGRNVQFNFLNQILWVALLLFAKSARTARPAPTPDSKPSKKRAAPRASSDKSATQTGTQTEQTATQTELKETQTGTQTSAKINLHSLKQADSWQKFRWPRAHEEPLLIDTKGYTVLVTHRAVKIVYNSGHYSLATVKGWIKNYEKRGNQTSPKYKEYCTMAKILQQTKEELDAQKPLQAAG
ncbi:MAG: hypothetical protein ACRBFS_07985 [Aureispira sp.]